MVDKKPNHFEKENCKIYSRVNKLCKNSSPSFLSIRKRCKDPFYTLLFILGTSPKVSEQLNYRRKNKNARTEIRKS